MTARPGKAPAIFHELIRVTFEDTDPLTALPDILALVHPNHRGRYAAVLAPDWHPDQATEFNGAVWPCLGSAVWSLRTTTSFEDAIRAAIDLGGDTDTVAAVTGGLAGAYYGLDQHTPANRHGTGWSPYRTDGAAPCPGGPEGLR
ncbi:hypothetical protein QFZ58_006670 [Streptomyces sp. B1I3]|nr:hypothetical protein [Streptomyces sp. B1I3]